jgi:ribonuclease R
MLLEMKELALCLQSMRRKRGSIDFDLPEPEIIIGLTGQTEGIIRAERNLAHQLIEEFMLVANEAVATYITGRAIPFLYRIHEHPDPAKLINFQEFVYGFGYEFPLVAERVNPSELQRLLAQAEGRPEERMLNYALLRCMKQARYAAENLEHFGLASKCYCHFTSPIRRYPDLVVHRILRAALATGFDTAHPTPAITQPTNRALSGAEGKRAEKQLAIATERLTEIAEHTSKRERVAMEAERDVVELKKVQYMQRHLGEEFDGFITGVTGFGFFVELEELFVEGLVHITTLDDDLYSYMEKQHSLIGRHSKKVFRIGDTARVRVAAVVPATRRIEFVLVGHSASTTPVRTTGATSPHEEYPRIPLRGKRVGNPGKRTEKETKGAPGRSTGRTAGKRRR